MLTSGEIVSPSSVDAAITLAKHHWVTLSRSSFTSPNAPKHREIIVLLVHTWNCDSPFSNSPITLLLPSPTMAAANMMSRFLPLHLHSLTTSCWGNIILDNFELLLGGAICLFTKGQRLDVL